MTKRTFAMQAIFAMLALPAMLAAGVIYSYDAAGRLAKADYGAAGVITYTYDKAGNLLSRTVAQGKATGGQIPSVGGNRGEHVHRHQGDEPGSVEYTGKRSDLEQCS